MKDNCNILCGDCEKNYITEERNKKFGKCISCQRRETIAKTNNRPYIKFKDLPLDEKNRLIKQRVVNNNWAKKNNNKAQGINTIEDNKADKSLDLNEIPAEFLVGRFVNKYKYNTLKFVSIVSTELYDKFCKYCKSENCSVLSRHTFYSILVSKYGFTKKMSNGINYYFRGDTDGKSFAQATRELNYTNTSVMPSNKSRCNQIYTADMIEEIKKLASPEISATELKNIFIQRYPDLNITTSNFNNIIVRNNIPHSKGKTSKQNIVSEYTLVNPVQMNKKSSEDLVINNVGNIDNNLNKDINDSDVVSNMDDGYVKTSEILDEDGDPIRLSPIKQEVVSVLDEKYKKEKCTNAYNYTVDDYINMFEMFQYLANNIDDLIKNRDKQFNIINNYQFDIVHEMENELAKEGDTYLQDKMYVMRDYRRYMETDYKALKQMRLLLKQINNLVRPDNKVGKVLGQLRQVVKENAQPKFVPRVDVDMTKKYDWAVMRNSLYKRAVPDNTTSSVIESPIQELSEDSVHLHDTTVKFNKNLKKLPSKIELTTEQKRQGFSVYRVSCKISGNGFGVFKPWYKDYACVKEEIALAFAQQEFARLRAENGQVLVSDVECHKLNVE